MFLRKRTALSFLSVAALATGCAHVNVSEQIQGKDPRSVLSNACEPGFQVKSARGSAWLKVKSKDASGRFPADVEVTAPSSLRMEAHNLLGGTEAVITVQGDTYRVEIPNRKDRTQKGTGSWGGIPLEWATDLFLGKIPCPPSGAWKDARLSLGPEGELVVQTAPSLKEESQKFIYSFKIVNQKPWAEKLHWERVGFAPLSIDFKFTEPEDATRSPLRWEAKSALGEIKVQWKEREFQEAR